MMSLVLALFSAAQMVCAKSDFLDSAQKLYSSGQHAQVVTLLSDHADRLNEEGFMLLAAAYSELKQFDNEQRILKQLATKKEKDYRWPMLIAQSHQKKAATLSVADEKKKEETLAIAAYRQSLKLNPKFRPAFDSLLQLFLDRKENHEARELLMEGLRAFGPKDKWLNELCALQASDGFLEPAVKTCELAIRTSPNYPDNYVYLSQAYLDQEKLPKAQSVAQFAGKKFINSEFAQWAAGKVYLLNKNFEAARKYFDRAVKLDPNSKRSLEGLAEALFQSGNAEEAYPRFQAACRKGLKKSDHLHIKAAELRMKQKESLGAKYRGLAETCL